MAHVEGQTLVRQYVILNFGFGIQWRLYLKKLRLNPSDVAPLTWFEWVLKRWIQSGTLKDNEAKTILLGHTHYKYDIVENMAGLLDVINKESCASFLMDNVMKTITITYTTYSTKDVLIVWKNIDWEYFLLGLLHVRAMFKVVACIYDHESFKNLLTTMCILTFVTKIQFEFV